MTICATCTNLGLLGCRLVSMGRVVHLVFHYCVIHRVGCCRLLQVAADVRVDHVMTTDFKLNAPWDTLSHIGAMVPS